MKKQLLKIISKLNIKFFFIILVTVSFYILAFITLLFIQTFSAYGDPPTALEEGDVSIQAGLVIYVAGDTGSDTNNGDSWNTAKKTIASAISLAPSNPINPTHIYIKEGTYQELLTISNKNNIELYGAFKGIEDTSIFDPSDNDNRVGGATLVDGDFKGRCLSIKQSSNVTVDSLSMLNGLASGFGGGLAVSDSTAVTVKKVTISDSTTRYQLSGGGLYCSFSEISLYDVNIQRNTSGSDGGGGWLNGCGIWAKNLVVQSCLANRGGGLTLIGSYGVIARSAFNFNRATSVAEGGGAMYLDGSGQLTIQSSAFISNNATFGAALYFSNRSNGYLISSLIARNESTQQGAIIIRDSQTFPTIYNSTLARNIAGTGSPAIAMSEGTLLKLTNSVLASNTGPGPAVGRPLNSIFFSDYCTYYDNENGDLTFSFDQAASDRKQDPNFLNTLPAFWNDPLAYAHLPISHLTDYALPKTTESMLGSIALGLRRDQGAFEAPEPSMAEKQHINLLGWRGPNLDGDQSSLPLWIRVQKEGRLLREGWVPQAADGYYLIPLPYFVKDNDTFLIYVKSPGYLSSLIGAGEVSVLVGSTGLEVVLLPGDANNDNIVNIHDLNIMMLNFAKEVNSSEEGDINGDRIVNINDLTQVLLNWDKRGDG